MEDFKRYNEIVGIIENCIKDIFEMFDSYQEDLIWDELYKRLAILALELR